MYPVHQIACTPIAGQCGKQDIQIPPNVLISIRQVLYLLRCSPCIAANLRIDLIEIVVLHIVISLVDPENSPQQIGTAVFYCISSFILQSCVRHSKQQSIVLSPASQNRLNWNSILWDRVLNFQRSYVCLNYFLTKLVEMRGQYLIDVLHIYLHLKIMLHIVIDHLQQIYESTGIIMGTVDCGHLIVNAFALISDLQSRVGAKHIGKSASRAIIPELVKQCQQLAAVTWDGNILLKIVTSLFFKPAFTAEFPNQKACTAGDILQLLLVNIFPFKCGIRQLLLQSAAEHRIQRVLAYF